MLNYLSLLGWNDGSEQEIYSVDELQQAFSLDRITKSAAGGQGCGCEIQAGV
jgi:glutamyl-tRNA synthetase